LRQSPDELELYLDWRQTEQVNKQEASEVASNLYGKQSTDTR